MDAFPELVRLVVRRHIARRVGKMRQVMKEEMGHYTVYGKSSLLND
jgi:hypothetical protein